MVVRLQTPPAATNDARSIPWNTVAKSGYGPVLMSHGNPRTRVAKSSPSEMTDEVKLIDAALELVGASSSDARNRTGMARSHDLRAIGVREWRIWSNLPCGCPL